MSQMCAAMYVLCIDGCFNETNQKSLSPIPSLSVIHCISKFGVTILLHWGTDKTNHQILCGNKEVVA